MAQFYDQPILEILSPAGTWRNISGSIAGMSISKQAKFRIELPDGNVISGKAHVVTLDQTAELGDLKTWSIELSGTGQFNYESAHKEPVTVFDEAGNPVKVIATKPIHETDRLPWVQRLKEKAQDWED